MRDLRRETQWETVKEKQRGQERERQRDSDLGLGWDQQRGPWWAEGSMVVLQRGAAREAHWGTGRAQQWDSVRGQMRAGV